MPESGTESAKKVVSSEPYRRPMEAYVSATGCATCSSVPPASSSSPPYAGGRCSPLPAPALKRRRIPEGQTAPRSAATGAAGALQRRGQRAAAAAADGISERASAGERRQRERGTRCRRESQSAGVRRDSNTHAREAAVVRGILVISKQWDTWALDRTLNPRLLSLRQPGGELTSNGLASRCARLPRRPVATLSLLTAGRNCRTVYKAYRLFICRFSLSL
jgi:hypothetical protein